jgi:hypothetical protein
MVSKPVGPDSVATGRAPAHPEPLTKSPSDEADTTISRRFLAKLRDLPFGSQRVKNALDV